jgi:hypothetical protein
MMRAEAVNGLASGPGSGKISFRADGATHKTKGRALDACPRVTA